MGENERKLKQRERRENGMKYGKRGRNKSKGKRKERN
jgi:hypothetical protein